MEDERLVARDLTGLVIKMGICSYFSNVAFPFIFLSVTGIRLVFHPFVCSVVVDSLPFRSRLDHHSLSAYLRAYLPPSNLSCTPTYHFILSSGYPHYPLLIFSIVPSVPLLKQLPVLYYFVTPFAR